jgi:hypothetical protein
MADWDLKSIFTVQHYFPILQSKKFLYMSKHCNFSYSRAKYTKMDLLKDYK